MLNLLTYVFDELYNVRIITDDKLQLFFIAKDISTILGYKQPENAIKRHCVEVISLQVILNEQLHSIPNEIKNLNSQLKLIREPDILNLIYGSELKVVNEFKTWLFDETLPSIYKRIFPNTIQNPIGEIPNLNDIIPDLVKSINVITSNLEEVTKKLNLLAPKAEIYNYIVNTNKNDLFSFAESAKLLDNRFPLIDNQYKLSNRIILQALRQKNIVNIKNIPYQQYVDKGYFKYKYSEYYEYNTPVVYITSGLVTHKGLEFLIKILKQTKNLPLVLNPTITKASKISTNRNYLNQLDMSTVVYQ